MNRYMIMPIVVGFICLIVAIVAATGPIISSFVTNDRGQGATLSNGMSYDVSSGLPIHANGYEANQGTITNNMTGTVIFKIYNMPYQFAYYNIPGSGTHQIFVEMRPSLSLYMQYNVGPTTDNPSLIDVIAHDVHDGSNKIRYNSTNLDGYDVVFQTINPADNIDTQLTLGYGFEISLVPSLSGYTGSSGNILGTNGVIAILLAAIVIGGVAAVSVFGTGIDYFGQRLIFASSTYVVLWIILSLGMSVTVNEIPVVGNWIWLVLTALFFFGVVQEVMKGEDPVGGR